METLLQYFIEYRYLVIFFGTFIEGEVVLIAGGFLVYDGYLNFTVMVLIATLAAIIGDDFFYWLGRGQRAGARHPWVARSLNFIGEHRLFTYLKEKSSCDAMVGNRSSWSVSSTGFALPTP